MSASNSSECEHYDDGRFTALQDEQELEASAELWEVPFLHSVLCVLGLSLASPLSSVQALDEELRDDRGTGRRVLVVELVAPLLEALSRACGNGSVVGNVRSFDKVLVSVLDSHELSPWHAHLSQNEKSPLNGTSFFSLRLEVRLLYLRTLLELFLSQSPGLAAELQPQDHDRPLGVDALGDSYWYFGGTNVYRYSGSLQVENETMDEMNSTWELVCEDVSSWEREMALLFASTHPQEQALRHQLLPIFTTIQEYPSNEGRSSQLALLKAQLARRIRNSENVDVLDMDASVSDADVYSSPKKKRRRLDTVPHDDTSNQAMQVDDWDIGTADASATPKSERLEEWTSDELRIEWSKLDDEIVVLRRELARLEALRTAKLPAVQRNALHISDFISPSDQVESHQLSGIFSSIDESGHMGTPGY